MFFDIDRELVSMLEVVCSHSRSFQRIWIWMALQFHSFVAHVITVSHMVGYSLISRPMSRPGNETATISLSETPSLGMRLPESHGYQLRGGGRTRFNL